jgi:hypothetical protein
MNAAHARRSPRVNATRWGSFLWLIYAGCASSDAVVGVPTPDGELFVQETYPLLLENCAFSTCHGDSARFFQVYGPGRARLNPANTDPLAPMNLPEILHSYQRTRSMLGTSSDVERSFLLSKPLQSEQGGQGHRGLDSLGHNVFASKLDPRYQQLLALGRSTGEPPTQEQVDALIAASEELP